MNALFHQASRYYRLNGFGQLLPGNEARAMKAIADMFEAWIGFGVDSRKRFDKGDELTDLRLFFNQFYALRYHELLLYTYSEQSPIPPVLSIKESKISEVRLGNDALLQRNLLKSRVGQLVGFLVTLLVEPDPDDDDDKPQRILRAFALTKEEAEKMKALKLWTCPRPPPPPPNRGLSRKFPPTYFV